MQDSITAVYWIWYAGGIKVGIKVMNVPIQYKGFYIWEKVLNPASFEIQYRIVIQHLEINSLWPGGLSKMGYF